MARTIVASVAAGFVITVCSNANAQVATTPGAITTPYPTTQSIAVEWAISGDSNNDGVVAVRYRPAGSNTWLNAMALKRIPAGQNTTGNFGSGNGQWTNRHSGSLFNLQPGTTYEIELNLTDPDGGSSTKTTTATTRSIPEAPASAIVKSVTPATLAAALAAAQPGDLLVLGAGTYAAFTLNRSGSAALPIVVRGESADTVTIQGRVTLSDLAYVFLENVTVQGEVRMNGSSNMVIRGCRIRTTAGGITFEIGDAVPRNNYVVDNDVIGGANWVDDQLSADGYDGGEGIQFTGSGHVICFNHVKGFRDNISLMEYDEAYEQISIDICNNDIEQATDDAIEADSAMGNVRVVSNRIKNCFDGASSQPNLGGPSYFIRNVMYNVIYSPFKFHNGTVGDVVLHNSVVKCGDAFGCYAGEKWSRAVFRNNLFIGGTGGGTYGGYANGNGRVLNLADADSTCSLDYDGLGSVGTSTFAGRIGSATFDSLATLHANTTEQHAIAVDLSVFAASVAFPSNPYPPKSDVDLRLQAGSVAVDQGQVIIGLNDDFSGVAPDLGAYELGAAVPQYGPRAAGAAAAGSPGVGGAAGTVNTLVANGGSGRTNAASGGSGGLFTGFAMNDAGAFTGGNAPNNSALERAGSPTTSGVTQGGSKSDGCSCRVAARERGAKSAWILLAALGLLVRQRGWIRSGARPTDH